MFYNFSSVNTSMDHRRCSSALDVMVLLTFFIFNIFKIILHGYTWKSKTKRVEKC